MAFQSIRKTWENTTDSFEIEQAGKRSSDGEPKNGQEPDEKHHGPGTDYTISPREVGILPDDIGRRWRRRSNEAQRRRIQNRLDSHLARCDRFHSNEGERCRGILVSASDLDPFVYAAQLFFVVVNSVDSLALQIEKAKPYAN